MALDKTKTNFELGQEIQKALVKHEIETPMVEIEEAVQLDDRRARIREKFEQILTLLGMDLRDDSMKDTPDRLMKMYMNEIFWGMNYENFPKITSVQNKMQYNEMVIETNIRVNSFCEHHLVPISGVAHVAYIPDKKVIGLSKMNRIVEFFCRRPQIQERLTEQIYLAMATILETRSVAVTIHASHYCVISRGVEDPNSKTITSKLGGGFDNLVTRQEFLNLVRNASCV